MPLRPSFGSSYKSSTTSKSSSTKSTTVTNSRYIPTMYTLFIYQTMLINTYYLTAITNKEYMAIDFANVDEMHYCPINGCTYVNDTTIRTPFKGNINVAKFQNIIINVKNITSINSILSHSYGCSMDFNNCLQSDSTKIYPNYFLFVLLIVFVTFT